MVNTNRNNARTKSLPDDYRDSTQKPEYNSGLTYVSPICNDVLRLRSLYINKLGASFMYSIL